jgi:hypothetical protein
MATVTLIEFRATLRLTWVDAEGCGEKVFSYWNNESVTQETCDREEVLHIVRRPDGTFYLQIANLVWEGSLEELEEALYAWALDEGWFECPPADTCQTSPQGAPPEWADRARRTRPLPFDQHCI